MKLLVCDDQRTIRTGLALLLGLEPDLHAVGLAGDGLEAVDLAGSLAPDLVLTDLKMPRMHGIEATRQIRGRYPAIHILVLTTFDDDVWLLDALQAGAAGFILKDSAPDELLKAIRGIWAAPPLSLWHHLQHPPVTRKEMTGITMRGLTFLLLSAGSLMVSPPMSRCWPGWPAG